jgi:hypothetical protein
MSENLREDVKINTIEDKLTSNRITWQKKVKLSM